MKRKQTIPQKPSKYGMTEREVKTLWIYEHANKIRVRLYPPEGSDNDRT